MYLSRTVFYFLFLNRDINDKEVLFYGVIICL